MLFIYRSRSNENGFHRGVGAVAAIAALATTTPACTKGQAATPESFRISQEEWTEAKKATEEALVRVKANGIQTLTNLQANKSCRTLDHDPVRPTELADEKTGIPAGAINTKGTIRCEGVPGITSIKVNRFCADPLTRVIGENVIWEGCKDKEGIRVTLTGLGGLKSETYEPGTKRDEQGKPNASVEAAYIMASGSQNQTLPEIAQKEVAGLAQVYIDALKGTEVSGIMSACPIGNVSSVGFVTYERGKSHVMGVTGECPAVLGTFDVQVACADYNTEKKQKGGEGRFKFCNASELDQNIRPNEPIWGGIKVTTGTNFGANIFRYVPRGMEARMPGGFMGHVPAINIPSAAASNQTPATLPQPQAVPIQAPAPAPTSSPAEAPAASTQTPAAPSAQVPASVPAAPAAKREPLETICTFTTDANGTTPGCEKIERETLVWAEGYKAKAKTNVGTVIGNTVGKPGEMWVCKDLAIPMNHKKVTVKATCTPVN